MYDADDSGADCSRYDEGDSDDFKRFRAVNRGQHDVPGAEPDRGCGVLFYAVSDCSQCGKSLSCESVAGADYCRGIFASDVCKPGSGGCGDYVYRSSGYESQLFLFGYSDYINGVDYVLHRKDGRRDYT